MYKILSKKIYLKMFQSIIYKSKLIKISTSSLTTQNIVKGHKNLFWEIFFIFFLIRLCIT